MKNITIFAAIACALNIPFRFWGFIESIVGYNRVFAFFNIESSSAIEMYFRVVNFLGYVAGLISSFAMLVFFKALIKRQKLKELVDKEVITKEEYDTQRKRILADL